MVSLPNHELPLRRLKTDLRKTYGDAKSEL